MSLTPLLPSHAVCMHRRMHVGVLIQPEAGSVLACRIPGRALQECGVKSHRSAPRHGASKGLMHLGGIEPKASQRVQSPETYPVRYGGRPQAVSKLCKDPPFHVSFVHCIRMPTGKTRTHEGEKKFQVAGLKHVTRQNLCSYHLRQIRLVKHYSIQEESEAAT